MNISKELHENVLNDKMKKIKANLEQQIEITNKGKNDPSQTRLNMLVERMVQKTKAIKGIPINSNF